MNLKKPSVLLYAFISLLTFIVGCSYSSNAMPKEMPQDFDFSLNYGINGAAKIDTFNDAVIKDLVQDGKAEAKITLSEKEMKGIYEKMKEINIMGELDVTKSERCEVIPASHSSWEIVMDGRIKNLEYGEDCGWFQRDIKKLRQLEDYIHNIVSAKDEYKKLPEPKGAYE